MMVDVGGLWRWVWADFGFWFILDFSYGGRWVVGWLVDFGFWLWLSAVGYYELWWWGAVQYILLFEVFFFK